MQALSRRQFRRAPLEADHSAEVISAAELNRARSHRTLDRAQDDGRVEDRPWAYVFPRPIPH